MELRGRCWLVSQIRQCEWCNLLEITETEGTGWKQQRVLDYSYILKRIDSLFVLLSSHSYKPSSNVDGYSLCTSVDLYTYISLTVNSYKC